MGNITFKDGTTVPALGLGTWRLAENRRKRSSELAALKEGILAGMTVLDTAEMYADGGAERLLGEAIAQTAGTMERGKIFIVSKVYPHNAGRDRIFDSCERSLRNIGIEALDMYLLHWRGRVPLTETVECMEELIKLGKIKRWGVSNFDTGDMEELWQVKDGKNCACNQVLYHAASRGIEFELVPWLEKRGVPIMAYCPLAQAGRLKEGLFQNKILRGLAARRGATVAQILLAFITRLPGLIAIPCSGNAAHVRENSRAKELCLTQEELSLIDREFPKPPAKVPLDME